MHQHTHSHDITDLDYEKPGRSSWDKTWIINNRDI